MVQKDETSFFRDFVDNSDLRIGNALLTEEGRGKLNGVQFEVRGCLAEVFRKLPNERTEKLLRMVMIEYAVLQDLYEIARNEDNKTST